MYYSDAPLRLAVIGFTIENGSQESNFHVGDQIE